MKKILLVSIVLSSFSFLHGQNLRSTDNTQKDNIKQQSEFDFSMSNVNFSLSNGVNLLSLTYEHQLLKYNEVRLTLSGGMGLLNQNSLINPFEKIDRFSIQTGIGALIAKKRNRFELGLNFSMLENLYVEDYQKWTDYVKIVATPSVAHVFVPKNKLTFFKLKLSYDLELGQQQFKRTSGLPNFGVTIRRYIGRQ